jgi:hypothetical protein
MKRGRLQAKDIPDVDFLGQVRRKAQLHHGMWTLIWDLAFPVLDGLPDEDWGRLVRAKAARLIARGLLDGCTCGCRGDFELTAKGEAYLDALGGAP